MIAFDTDVLTGTLVGRVDFVERASKIAAAQQSVPIVVVGLRLTVDTTDDHRETVVRADPESVGRLANGEVGEYNPGSFDEFQVATGAAPEGCMPRLGQWCKAC